MKTLGSRAAQLLTELHERRQPTFTLADVRDITGLSPTSARTLIFKAERRGLLTRLKPGLYNLVPFELGRATHHVANPYLIARGIVGGEAYYLSHGTAFELHRLVTQPQLTLYISGHRRHKPQMAGGYALHFVFCPPTQMFGLTRHWIDGESWVCLSDLERTLVDGLRHPAWVGGLSEVAKGLWMRHGDLDVPRLVDYAVRLGVGAVIRRLGYLLEFYELASQPVLQPLRDRLTATYQRLDPLLPAEGPFLARWRLQLNVAPEELQAVRWN